MFKDIAVFILSLVILNAFFVATYFIFSGSVKTQDPQMLLLIGTAFGNVSTLAGGVVAYWFGTTKGSADKDRTTFEAVNKLPVSPSATVSATVTSTPEPNKGA